MTVDSSRPLDRPAGRELAWGAMLAAVGGLALLSALLWLREHDGRPADWTRARWARAKATAVTGGRACRRDAAPAEPR